MEIEKQLNESEVSQKPEGWFVDDNEDAQRAYARHLERKFGENFQLKYFLQAKEMLERFLEILETGGILPSFIFLDCNLDKDEGELKEGPKVIGMINDLCQEYGKQRPYIMGMSADETYTEKLKEAGADHSFSKKDIFEAIDHVKQRFEQGEEQ